MDRQQQTDRHTETQTHRHTDTQTATDRHTDTQTHRHTYSTAYYRGILEKGLDDIGSAVCYTCTHYISIPLHTNS